MQKLLRNVLIFGLVATMLFGSFTTVFADEAPAQGTTEAPAPVVPAKKEVKINKITTDANARVKVHFAKSVEYSADLTVCVKNEAGEVLTSTIAAKGKNCLTLKVTGAVCKKVYTVAIDGIKVKGEKEFASVTGTFKFNNLKTKAKAAKLSKKIKVKKNLVLKLKMNQKVCYKDVTVCVKDADGNVYEAKITKKNSRQIFVSVKGLKKKTTYTITITGIKTKKEAVYGTYTTTFKTK